MASKFYIFCVWLTLSGFSSLVLSQSVNDTSEINAPECGRLSEESMRTAKKRNLFGQVASLDDTKWAWHVLLIGKAALVNSGSLINSQWVLTRAESNK
jgi:hypothetical protein